jgi:hypothetical protein
VLSNSVRGRFSYTEPMKVIFLNWFERAALHILVRSPRIGMLAVKEMDGPLLFIANNPLDGMPIGDSNPVVNQLEHIYRNSSTRPEYGQDSGVT